MNRSQQSRSVTGKVAKVESSVSTVLVGQVFTILLIEGPIFNEIRMNISVMGCGWLGFPLSKHLINQGHKVKGSSSTKGRLKILDQHGIEPYHIFVSDHIECQNCEDFWNTDLLFLNIPPGRSKGDVIERHPEEIKAVTEQVRKSGIPWVIFASSTSVYSKYGGLKTEEDIEANDTASDSGRALIQCEELLRNSAGFDATILRFGGLYGYDRHPGRRLAGRKNLAEANKPVNLIHQDDCIRIIHQTIAQNLRNDTLNAVSDEHPDKRSFYKAMAARYNLPLPEFSFDKNNNYRIVSNRKLKKVLDYRFLYPDPGIPAP